MLWRRGLSELFSRSLSLFGFLAGFQSQIPCSEPNADLLQEIIGRRAAGKNPHKIVRHLLPHALNVKDDRIRLEFDWIRLKEHFDFSGAHAVFDALRVPLFDAAEALCPIAERHLVAGLVCESHSSLDRAVASANDKNLLVDVVIGFDQAIHHLGQFLTFDSEFARLARAPERQDHVSRTIFVVRCQNGEDAVFAFLDVVDFLAGAKH